MAPKRPDEKKLSSILDTVRGASFFADDHEFRARVELAVMDYIGQSADRLPPAAQDQPTAEWEGQAVAHFSTGCTSSLLDSTAPGLGAVGGETSVVGLAVPGCDAQIGGERARSDVSSSVLLDFYILYDLAKPLLREVR
jgi:hypothetical protein